MAGVKRKAAVSKQSDDGTKNAKKAKTEPKNYEDAESVKDENGEIIWPAPAGEIEAARSLIIECASSNQTTLIVPDKDADGLSSGVILHRTLTALGLSEDKIHVHLVQKGANIHDESEQNLMSTKAPSYVFVLDQGSRASSPVVDSPSCKILIIDHHYAATSSDFPEASIHVSACHSPPVATSSLLTYHICSSLRPSLQESTSWLAALGAFGDLGNTLKFLPPFPSMTSTLKQHTKKALTDAVPLINAPRRTATYDVTSAWSVLLDSTTPSSILKSERLEDARREVSREVERCTHTPPSFSSDSKIAVFRISSAAQVHPVIATRWAGYLKSSKLEIILVANDGYLPNQVNFSCRIAKCARDRNPPVDIIRTLKETAARDKGDLVERLGESFARGHKEASGGIVGIAEFEELMKILGVSDRRSGKTRDNAEGKWAGETSPKKEKKVKVIDSGQKNTLKGYFGKKVEVKTEEVK